MRYRLRTLMIVLALGPPTLAWYGWPVVQRMMQPPPATLSLKRITPVPQDGRWGSAVEELDVLDDERLSEFATENLAELPTP